MRLMGPDGRGRGWAGNAELRRSGAESDIVSRVSKSSVPRRALLRGGVVGATAASLGVLGAGAAAAMSVGAFDGDRAADAAEAAQGTAAADVGQGAARGARGYDFNRHWLFGGQYVRGAELPGHDDKGFARVTLPHTVTRLSWADWDYAGWQRVWIYRKHFDGAAVAGGRVLLTFDGVMTSATVVLNGATIGSHQGGYLPWTAELTGHLRRGDNVLAVIVDGRWRSVPPDAESGGPPTMDYLQPAGIYRDVRLDVVPEIYLADVFARPENVLSGDRAVRVQATVHAGTVPPGRTATISAELLDGSRVLGTARTTVRIGKTGISTAALTIGGFGAVGYWSPESPRLYTVRTTLSYKGGAHSVRTTTGFREAVFRTGGFYLNGSRYEIFGLNRHQMFPGRAGRVTITARHATLGSAGVAVTVGPARSEEFL